MNKDRVTFDNQDERVIEGLSMELVVGGIEAFGFALGSATGGIEAHPQSEGSIAAVALNSNAGLGLKSLV